MDSTKLGYRDVLIHHDPIGLHVYTDTGRFYQVNGHHYPGVGTILNTTDSFEQRQFWLKWRSQPGNIEYSDKAKDRGKLFHGMVENHFKTGNYRTDSQDDRVARSRNPSGKVSRRFYPALPIFS